MSDTLLDLMEAGALSSGTFQFGESEPVPIGGIWRSAFVQGTSVPHGRLGHGPIAMILSGSQGVLECIIASWLRGRAVLSLPYPARGMGVSSYRAQLSSLIDGYGIESIYVDDRYVGLLEDAGCAAQSVSDLRKALSACPLDPLGDEDVHLIQTTSGTLGEPKHVHLSGLCIGANIRAFLNRLGVAPGDRLCSWLPWSHDMGLIGMCLGAWVASCREWVNGGTALFLQPEDIVARPAYWLSAMSEESSTITASPPFMLDVAARSVRRRFGSADLSLLRAVVVGSTRISGAKARMSLDLLRGAGLRERAIVPAYGLAEATLAVSIGFGGLKAVALSLDTSSAVDYLDMVEISGEADKAAPGGFEECILCGPPLDGIQVRIDCEPGTVVGQVMVRSTSSAKQIDSERREPDEEIATGDLGFIWEGELGIVGRLDDRFKLGGQVVSSSAIVEVVADELQAKVRSIVAFADAGSGLSIVMESAYLARSSITQKELGAVRGSVLSRLGLVPRSMIVVQRGSIPTTASGKVRRREVMRQTNTGQLQTVEVR